MRSGFQKGGLFKAMGEELFLPAVKQQLPNVRRKT